MSKAGKEKKLKRKDTGYPQPASAEPVWEHEAAFQVRAYVHSRLLCRS